MSFPGFQELPRGGRDGQVQRVRGVRTAWDYPQSLNDVMLAPTHTIAETMPRWAAGTDDGGVFSNSAWLYSTLIALPGGASITRIAFSSRTTAANTPTFQWFAIYDTQDPTVPRLMACTLDDGATAWAAQTEKTLGLRGGSWIVPESGLYYVGEYVVATARPSLACAAASTSAGRPPGNTSIATMRLDAIGGGLATAPGTLNNGSLQTNGTGGIYARVL